MVVHAQVRVAQIACGFREREQIVERASLALERDQWKVYTEFHPRHGRLFESPRSRLARRSGEIPDRSRSRVG
jgi:hypothetical protein